MPDASENARTGLPTEVGLLAKLLNRRLQRKGLIALNAVLTAWPAGTGNPVSVGSIAPGFTNAQAETI